MSVDPETVGGVPAHVTAADMRFAGDVYSDALDNVMASAALVIEQARLEREAAEHMARAAIIPELTQSYTPEESRRRRTFPEKVAQLRPDQDGRLRGEDSWVWLVQETNGVWRGETVSRGEWVGGRYGSGTYRGGRFAPDSWTRDPFDRGFDVDMYFWAGNNKYVAIVGRDGLDVVQDARYRNGRTRVPKAQDARPVLTLLSPAAIDELKALRTADPSLTDEEYLALEQRVLQQYVAVIPEGDALILGSGESQRHALIGLMPVGASYNSGYYGRNPLQHVEPVVMGLEGHVESVYAKL